MRSFCALAPWLLAPTGVTAAADVEEPMAMAVTANAMVSARQSIGTPLGNGPATTTVRKLAPACHYFRPESSANSADRQAWEGVPDDLRGGLGAIANGCGLACPLWLERRSVEKPDRQRADRDDAEKDQSEGDVRLTLGVVLCETVYLVFP